MYRFHLADPIMFADRCTVTVQQLGAVLFLPGQEAEMAAVEDAGRLAGQGWQRVGGGALTFGIVERVDDVCATAFVYCTEPQPVGRLDVAGAIADVGRRPYEVADPMEAVGAPVP
jgi:hypothetical protein